ncbi:RNA polymerase I-specific transcription initiation factor RRN3 homolog Tif-IA [Brevipalpus obovatus]|uniref:RNA polymerase I-specific transcription initiation factor RRN3 homolog Tif-IA n=1 Tax=Brevipalpus obovatus TaxID=246614 RepID=UPI003D9E5C89
MMMMLSSGTMDSLFKKNWSDIIYKECVDGIDIGNRMQSMLLDVVSEKAALSPMILKNFLTKIVTQLFLGDPKLTGEEDISPSEMAIFNKLHYFLKEIIETYPHSSRDLVRATIQRFPHHQTRSGHSLLAYTCNTCILFEYLPVLYQPIAAVIDKLIWLELSSQTIDSSMETDDESIKVANKFSIIFDKIFDLLLETIYDMVHPNGRVRASGDLHRSDLFLNIFEKIYLRMIAPVDSLVNLPYCLLYWCSFSEEICTQAIDVIWAKISKIDDQKRAARYTFVLASMLVEATYITSEMIMNFIETATTWALEYCDEHSDLIIDQNFDPSNHSKFYAISQSIFYVISCKITTFTEIQLKNLRFLRLQKVLQSPLNPLLFCLTTISDQFAKISHHHEIAMCSFVLERNKRLNYDPSSYFNRSLCYYFPFHSHTFQLSSPKFDSITDSIAIE